MTSLTDTTKAEAKQLEKIPTREFATSGEACRQLAAEVAELIRAKAAKGEQTVLGLATGSTPVPFYKELIRLHKEEGLSFATVITFNLDEYYGLEPDHPESYSLFMRDQLFDHVDIPAGSAHVPDGMLPRSKVLDGCSAYERAIKDAGGLDLQILGIGRTGHIGFNEPGSARDSRTRMVTLDRLTRRDAARDFKGEENVPRFAITMGVGTILEADKIVLMAWGEKKAPIVARSVEGDMAETVPATFLQMHGNAVFYIDEGASAELTRVRRPWLVGPVDWDGDMTRRAVTWLSKKVEKPVLKLVEEEYRENGMGDLLTKEENWSNATLTQLYGKHGGNRVPDLLKTGGYNLNISIFNGTQRTITGWPGGKFGGGKEYPDRSLPYPKRCLIFSPEPHDNVICMGGTLYRLAFHLHEVTVACQTSGSLSVPDEEAERFLRALLQVSQGSDSADWKGQAAYAERMLQAIAAKGEFGEDTKELRNLKSLIRRSEFREACRACSLDAPDENVRFLNLPFYERGRYRRFEMTEEDVAIVANLLNEIRPDQIYCTGGQEDPSSVQNLCFQAVMRALDRFKGKDWVKGCSIWLYPSIETELEAHEIDMAVPLSPDELASKLHAIPSAELAAEAKQRNKAAAKLYDDLGLAEYEALETFQRYELS